MKTIGLTYQTIVELGQRPLDAALTADFPSLRQVYACLRERKAYWYFASNGGALGRVAMSAPSSAAALILR